MFDNPNNFADYPLDRMGVQRKDPAFLNGLQRDPASLAMLVCGRSVAIQNGSLHWHSLRSPDLPPSLDGPLFLGMDGHVAKFAIAVTEEDADTLANLQPLRDVLADLSPTQAAVAGHALWLTGWHERHRYCARHGDLTEIADGGAKRVNVRTGTEHFPRTDPVAITLPIHEDSVCLGRGPLFPPGVYSAFAGFLEPCETLEACAAREVEEEAGLTLHTLRYCFSQPWPFPSSLMVGFLGWTNDRELTLDPTEIEAARWLSRQQVNALLRGDIVDDVQIPPPFTIAHQLLKVWAER
ncbi:NAD(+) diphosphatase [Parvularcula sp. LCG005]|uniref:NAD(+) diphosphatase n=1 Tax=Parvularcula sp. LCG005 TaxID=3078805 RepID=UPI002942CC6F|nr:NAD(+) diphosphatase [Parvularcula sp. LCG005]WOI53163.1 NAD(+) diphosphatase [Parvularcula sp. LCG005]